VILLLFVIIRHCKYMICAGLHAGLRVNASLCDHSQGQVA